MRHLVRQRVLATFAASLLTVLVSAPVYGATSPTITFISPSPAEGAVTSDSVTFAFTYNRKPRATRALTCDLSGPTSTTTACDAPVASGAKGSQAGESYSGLASGEYTFTVTLTLTDGGTVSAMRHFIVSAANAGPVAVPQSVSTDEDTPLLITLSATDADDDALTFSIESGPDHGGLGSLSAPDCTTTPGTCTATVTYTPDSEFSGSDGFTFTANDGAADSVAAAISITVDPVKESASSFNPSISADGRFVAFQSILGGISQVFVHDRQLGNTQLVSVSSDGTTGNNGSSNPVISADGRFVAFSSNANNLVTGDGNSVADVFVHDRQTGSTTRVSVTTGGVEGDASSGGEGNAISDDGRFVAFWSAATNLVTGDTNGIEDVFVHDRQTAATTRVSVATGGTQQTGSLGNLERGADISGDGRFVVFLSLAADLVAGDTNGWADVFMHDRQAGTTTRVSVSSIGTQGNQHSFDPAISADGRYVTFMSSASDLVANDNNPCNPPNVECSVPTWIDVFVRDTQTNTTTLVSKSTDGTQANFAPTGTCDRQLAISADGRFVAFCSTSTNLVAGDTNNSGDIFVHDRQTGETSRVNVATDGTQADDLSFAPVLSADGRFVGFWSWSGALATGDTAERSPDVFVRDRQTTETTRVSDGV